jgi:hypothetical protein
MCGENTVINEDTKIEYYYLDNNKLFLKTLLFVEFITDYDHHESHVPDRIKYKLLILLKDYHDETKIKVDPIDICLSLVPYIPNNNLVKMIMSYVC